MAIHSNIHGLMPIIATMEHHKAGLEEHALSLIIDHQVPHATVSAWITKALLERVKDLQKIPVAFNRCHGGFNLSKHFQQFMVSLYTGRSYREVVEDFLKRPLTDTEAVAQYCDRVAIALAIPLYGRHICKEYPDIALMYSKKSISKLLHVALMMEKEKKSMSNCLDKTIVAITESKIKDLESKENWCNAPMNLRGCLLEYAREVINREYSPNRGKKGAFIDNALEDYPGSLEHAWSNTGDKEAYCFLNKLRASHPLIYHNMFGDLYELEVRLGRFCAAGTYASLSIGHVHQHVHFDIREYDGLEYISGN